jgi:predicted DNA-binding protein YlxM (UPF0122 family)
MYLLDGEVAKDIKGYEGRYAITNCGRVWSYKKKNNSPKFLKKEILKLGYERVKLGRDGDRISVHRLVASAFISNEDNKPCVNHIDANPCNNHVDNLEWCTHKENTNHAQNIGNMKLVTKETKKLILKKYETGNFSHKELADKYNVSTALISRNTSHLPNRMAKKIIGKNKEGIIMKKFESIREAARNMNVSHQAIMVAIKKNNRSANLYWEVI